MQTNNQLPSMDAAEVESDRRIREAKAHLQERIQELGRRIDGLKENLDPRVYVANPWVRAGAAFAIGYLLGRSRILGPIVKAGMSAVAAAVVREFVARQLAPESESEIEFNPGPP